MCTCTFFQHFRPFFKTPPSKEFLYYIFTGHGAHALRAVALSRAVEGRAIFNLFRFESQSVDGEKLYQVDSTRCVIYSAGLYARQQQNPGLGRLP